MMDAAALEKELGGKYQVTGLLGEGGMGAVFRARHVALHKDVAIKVLTGHSDASVGERMLREARIAAKIQSPHVVTCYDFGFLEGLKPYMVMELVDGPSLRARIQEGPLPVGDLRRFMLHAAQGVEAAAELGVMHRDLKPANMLLAPNGDLKIADFGLARLTATSGPTSLRQQRPLTAMGMVLGTPHYMAPEQAWNPQESDTRADVYGYGASFYHAATGKRPFNYEDTLMLLLAHRREIPARPQSIRPDLPDDVQSILERCLGKDPKDRFQSFDEIIAALQNGGTKRDPGLDPALGAYAAHYHQVRTSLLAGGPPGPAAAFQFQGDRTLSVVRANIADVAADALVSSDDGQLTMAGGVAKALNDGSGGVCFTETRKYVPVRHGGVVVTSAGALRARFVFHAITLDWDHGATYRPTRDLILRLLEGCLYQAETLRLQSLALPLLGTGTAGFSASECLDTIVSLLVKTMLRGGTGLTHITLVLRPGA